MAETYFQVTLDITEEWNIAYSRDDEQKKGASKDEDSEEGGDGESGRDQVIPSEIFLQIVPRRLIVLSRQIDGKQRQSIDNLTRTIGEKQTLPAYNRV